jgi:hypothetical protein
MTTIHSAAYDNSLCSKMEYCNAAANNKFVARVLSNDRLKGARSAPG